MRAPDVALRSALKQQAGAYLARWKPLAQRDLNFAFAYSALAGLAIIAQALLVARILDLALFGRQPLAELRAEFAALLIIFCLRFWAGRNAERMGFSAAIHVMRAIRIALFDRLDRTGPSGLADQPSGEIVATLSDGVRAIEPYFSRYLPAISQVVILPLAILLVVLPIDWLTAVVFAVTAPLIPVFMILIGKGAEALNQRQWLRLTRMSGHFLDAVQGLATLRAFGAGTRMVKAVAETADGYRRETMAVLRLAFLSSLTLEFFATISIAIVAVLIGFRLMWSQMSYFQGLFVLLLAPEFYLPLRTMGGAYHARMEALGAAERLVALEARPEVSLQNGTRLLNPANGITIIFEDVHLVYPDGRKALQGVSFEVQAGETLALAGPSGAGKSSIQALLLGFIRPTSGRILINCIPLEDLDLVHWRRQIGFIPQKPRLFSQSVLANIAPDTTTPDPERARQAAAAAAVDDVIADLPDQYATRVGEGGRGLSGGEAHRLALARAFYRNAPLVLLDEPTAHLDQESEARINEALQRLRQGRTLIIIAHRPASLALADRVLRLVDGRAAV